MASENQTLNANIAAIATACQSLSTSLGPRGLDKLIISSQGGSKNILTNDGATILKTMAGCNPALKVLSNLSQSQDAVCGDGTTSVVLLCGAVLESARALNMAQIAGHDIIMQNVKDEALRYLKRVCQPVSRSEDTSFGKNVKSGPETALSVSTAAGHGSEYRHMKESVVTCLGSKVIGGCAEMIADIAVEAVQRVGNVRDIKILKKVGGGMENIELVRGVALHGKVKNPEIFGNLKDNCKGIKDDSKVSLKNEFLIGEKVCRTAFIQFCISSPKTDLDSRVLIKNDQFMQKLIEDEKKYILDLCKRIKDAGVELLIIQKSILRESLSSVGLHFLGQMGVLVVDDVDRKEMEHLCKVFNVEAISDISLIKSCGLFRIKEVESFGSKITILERAVDGIETSIKELSIGNSVSEFKSINSVTGDSVITTGRDNKLVGLIQGNNNGASGIQAGSIGAPGTNKKFINNPTSIVIRGGDSILIDEIERSVHDGLCVAKSLLDEPFLVAGGGTIEMGIAKALMMKEGSAVEKMCYREIGRAFEMIAFYLARNAGMDPISILKKLRNTDGRGVCVKHMDACDMFAENIVQPLKVAESVVCGAIETAMMILKIDDMLPSRE